MGDGSDQALDNLMDMDELWERGEYPTIEDMEDGYIPIHPFTKFQPKASGPGPCPICSGPTEERKGPYGKFFGCKDYPKCRGNRNSGE